MKKRKLQSMMCAMFVTFVVCSCGQNGDVFCEEEIIDDAQRLFC